VTTAAVLPAPARRDEDGFILPRNLDAEKSVLGAALVDGSAADYVCDQVGADAFFRRAHRDIFLAMRAVRDEKVAVDYLTVKTQLERMGKLDDVGGPAYITGLADGVPRSTNVDHYAAILRDLQAKRALVHHANRTLDLVAAGEHGSAAILIDADRRLMELQTGHAESRMRTLGDSYPELAKDLEWRVEHKGELTGVETGFKSINELTFGWQPGELIVIAARPSIGKTTFAMNSAVAAASKGARVAVFSLEMRRKQLEYRLMAQLSNVPLSRILGGFLLDVDYAKVAPAACTMAELPIAIDDRAGQTAWDIRAACRRLKADRGLDLVVVDYVQLMPGTLERRGASRNDEVTDISRRMKILADEMSVPVLLLSQLTRESEKRADPRPKLMDLRESGALEQDADLVCFLHRKHHRESGMTNFIVEKQRNGPTGTVNLTIDRDTTTFTDGGDEPPSLPLPADDSPKPPKHWRRGRRS
jgi:replicative DNA helicase